MTIGQVIGPVLLERTVENAQDLHWVQVKAEDRTIAALDLVGAKQQDLVLVCASDAKMLTPACPVDAAIIGIVSENGNRG